MSAPPRPYMPRRVTEVATAEADALISLPTGVLDDILTRVGLRDAVRTSALSRAWRRRWEALPSLDLDFPRTKGDKGASKGLRAVDSVLLRCPGRVRRFYAYLDELFAGRIDDWLLVFSRRGVEVFNLISVDSFLVLPSAVFSCGRLTTLRLYGCAIPLLPAGFRGFPELKNLALINVRFQEHGQYQLEEIIAVSPSLENLVLWGVEIAGDFTEWVIQAPNLQHLNIRSAEDLGWNIGGLPSLHSAEIDIRDYLGDRDFAKFLTGFASIRKLVICTRHSPLNGANILDTLPCTFGDLKSLKLYTQFCELPSILSTFCLLRNAPNLERLKIQIVDGAKQKYEANGEFQNALWTDGMCANLQFVQITGIHWLSNELSFIELILSKARLLRTLSVSHGDECSMSNEGSLNKLLNYTRASSHAEVLYEVQICRRIPLGLVRLQRRGPSAWSCTPGVRQRQCSDKGSAQRHRHDKQAQSSRDAHEPAFLSFSVILVVLCSLLAALSDVWLRTHQTKLELARFFQERLPPDKFDNNNYNFYGITTLVVFNFLMVVILLQKMIPISLYISIVLVGLGRHSS